MVTDLIQQHPDRAKLKCTKVEIEYQQDRRHYRALATLNNGDKLPIKIVDKNGRVYISLLK